jgi:hypothetical protein
VPSKNPYRHHTRPLIDFKFHGQSPFSFTARPTVVDENHISSVAHAGISAVQALHDFGYCRFDLILFEKVFFD